MSSIQPTASISCSSTIQNTPDARAMVIIAADELYKLKWDGLDETVFTIESTLNLLGEKRALMRFGTCIFPKEDFADVQKLVREKLSSSTLDSFVCREADALDKRVHAISFSTLDSLVCR